MTTTGRPPTTPTPTRRLKPPIRRTARNVLAFSALGLVLPIAVIAAVVVIYIAVPAIQADHETSPTTAADDMLDAMLHDRSTSSVTKYLCDNQRLRSQVNSRIEQIKRFNTRPGSAISYAWTVRLVARHGDQATVAANVQYELGVRGRPHSSVTQTWTLAMRNRSGWKVCAVRIPQ